MRISDYILEQDISIATCDDIEIAQCFAEMEVMAALVECYIKQDIIQEYCSGDISEFDVYMESGDTDTSTGNGENTEKEKAKTKWYQSILNLLKKIGTFFLKIMGKAPFSKLIEMVEDMPDYVEFEIPDRTTAIKPGNLVVRYLDVTKQYVAFAELLKNGGVNSVQAYRNIWYTTNGMLGSNKYTASTYMTTAEGRTLNKAQMLTILRELDEADVVPSVKKMLKNIDLSKKSNLSDDVVSEIKKIASKLSKEFNEVNKTLIQLQNSVIKKASKELKAEKREEKKAVRQAKRDQKKFERNAKRAAEGKSHVDYPDYGINDEVDDEIEEVEL